MFEIADKHDFKLGYKLLDWLKENNKRDAYNELKLKLRLFAQEVSDLVVVKEGRGQTWYKKVLPVKSMDDAEKYFENNIQYGHYTMRGEEGIWEHKIAKMGDKFVCYYLEEELVYI